MFQSAKEGNGFKLLLLALRKEGANARSEQGGRRNGFLKRGLSFKEACDPRERIYEDGLQIISSYEGALAPCVKLLWWEKGGFQLSDSCFSSTEGTTKKGWRKTGSLILCNRSPLVTPTLRHSEIYRVHLQDFRSLH